MFQFFLIFFILFSKMSAKNYYQVLKLKRFFLRNQIIFCSQIFETVAEQGGLIDQLRDMQFFIYYFNI